VTEPQQKPDATSKRSRLRAQGVAAGRAFLIAAGAALLVFLLLGVAMPFAISSVQHNTPSLRDGIAFLSWSLLIAAPICGAVFLGLFWVLYVRYAPAEEASTDNA
jgi:uncharacterized BrkB/YihY/UPF0761 family membrane protein